MKVYIVGAGATKGTFPEETCGVKGFGDSLVKIWPTWRDELKALATLVDHVHSGAGDADLWDLDAVWTHIDYYAKLHRALRTSDYGSEASVQLHRAVVAVLGKVGERTCELFSGNASRDPASLREILGAVDAGDTVASLNWDTLVEAVLFGLGRSVSQAPRPHRAEDCRLVKPHGSLSWIRTPGKSIKIDDGGHPLLCVPRHSDVSDTAQPLILGAVPLKSELVREVQAGTDVYDIVVEQWGALCDALKTADELVAVGYSFPPEDQYATFLIREALKARGPHVLGEVLFYETATQAPIVAERILKLLPGHGTKVTWKGGVARGVAPGWCPAWGKRLRTWRSYGKRAARIWPNLASRTREGH